MSTERYYTNWLRGYLRLVENTESPIQYHVWSALWAVAATLERRVWIDFGHLKIYPNMYVILVGPAATRKATPASVLIPMLRDIGVKLGTDNSTKEAMYRALLRSHSHFEHDSRIVYQHALALYSPELTVLLGMGDLEKIAWLTDWWDAADFWQKETIKDGVRAVRNLCVNLLGLTTPDQLPRAVPIDAHEGGFVSRTIFVAARKREKIVPFPELSSDHQKARNRLVHDLALIHKMVGPFQVTDEAKRLFTEIYEEYAEKEAERADTVRMSGYYGRRGTHLLKVSMVLSACERYDRLIEYEHVNRADKLLRAVEKEAEWLFGSTGRSKIARELSLLREAIRRLKVVRRSFLMQYFWQDMDGRTLQEAAVTLRDMQLIRIIYDPEGHDYIFEWIAEDDEEESVPYKVPLPDEPEDPDEEFLGRLLRKGGGQQS